VKARLRQGARATQTARPAVPRYVRRRPLDAPDVTTAADPGPSPEAVFDRVTGPYVRRAALREET
jgi:hypothetical protein